MIYDLLPEGDPFLNIPVPEFDFSNPPIDPMELANNLVETMGAHRAFGLAANQCGLPYRVFVLMPMGDSIQPIVCFNPEIDTTPIGVRTVATEEGCLSFPGLFLEVKRLNQVAVSFKSEQGFQVVGPMWEMHAVGFQHELDHLNGITFTSRVSKLKLDRALKARKKRVL